MPIFQYQAVDGENKVRKGIVDADSPREARIKLKRESLYVTELSEARKRGPRRMGLSGLSGVDAPNKARNEQVSAVTRQMASLLSAGIPLAEAMNLPSALLLSAILAANAGHAATSNLVSNGSFERSQARPGVPDDWASAGNPAIQQQLVLDTGRDGRACAKLVCTEFTGDGPDFHVMICQVGKVSVQKDQWYRLTFWAKGQGIPGGAVEVALSNMRPWDNAGLAEACSVSAQWQRFEFLFRSRSDLPAATSRLQFWFKGTGTLWRRPVGQRLHRADVQDHLLTRNQT